MKKKIIEVILVTIGIVSISYPIIANQINSYTKTEAILDYQEKISKLTKEQKQEVMQKAQEYNNEISQEYNNVLNIGEVIAYISIPKINIYLPIYQGTSEKVLQSGIGHIEGTSLPIGGKGSHSVIAGHTGLVRTKMFDDIDELEKGDKFYIHVLDNKLTYEVDDIKVVEPTATNVIEKNPSEDFVTLITCTPYMINSHRLLVRGKRAEEENMEEKAVEAMAKNDKTEKEVNTSSTPNTNGDINSENQQAKYIQTKQLKKMIISIIIFILILIIGIMWVLKNNKTL